MTNRCLACGSTDLKPVFTLAAVPVLCNGLAANEAEAKAAPTGDVALAVCTTCGLVFNAAFEADRMAYGSDYENALHHSASFRAFAEPLVSGLVERHGLEGGRVVEVGCGDGFMLRKFVECGILEGIGFDPSMAGRSSPFVGEDVRIVPRLFDAREVKGAFDAIICRHVLEHLADPAALLGGLRRQIGPRSVMVYFEVPNAEWILENHSIWDIIYEHVTYWSRPSIETLFRRCGFEPTAIDTGYSDQFLMVEARPAQPEAHFLPRGADAIVRSAASFGAACPTILDRWSQRLGSHAGGTVVWGAGSKAITFANALRSQQHEIIAMVDLNPRKHGRNVPVCATPIIAPGALPALSPALVVIANGLYEREIRAAMDGMGVASDVAVLTQ